MRNLGTPRDGRVYTDPMVFAGSCGIRVSKSVCVDVRHRRLLRRVERQGGLTHAMAGLGNREGTGRRAGGARPGASPLGCTDPSCLKETLSSSPTVFVLQNRKRDLRNCSSLQTQGSGCY